LPQNARYVPFSVQHSENLKRIASRFINDKVRENPVEKNLLVREISAAVAAVWDVGQLVKTFEQLSDNSVRRVHALLLQEVKPDGVNIEDGIFVSLNSPDEFLSTQPAFAALPLVRRPGLRRPVPRLCRFFRRARCVARQSSSLPRPGLPKRAGSGPRRSRRRRWPVAFALRLQDRGNGQLHD
jgi:hypothetical protein